MNTHVKVGLAAVIVATIVAIIVVDNSSTGGKSSAPQTPPADTAPQVEQRSGIVLHTPETAVQAPSPDPQAPIVERSREELERATSGIVKGAKAVEPESPGIKGQERPVIPPAPPTAPPVETYEVQQGDTLFVIAEKKYGDGNLYPLIVKANAKLDPNRLRVGQKLAIPSKDAKAPAPAEAPAVEETGTGKSYTVQAGDTLGEIAMRIYKTARRSVIDKIIESNPGLDVDGYGLHVGAKLTLPEIDARPAAPKVEASAVPTGFEGKKTYKVQANDSLWKIASKFKGKRDINEMMDLIVSANSDRLHSKSDALRVDWVLAIPD